MQFRERPNGDYAGVLRHGHVSSQEGVDVDVWRAEIRRQARQDRIRVITSRDGARGFAMLNRRIRDERAMDAMRAGLDRVVVLGELRKRSRLLGHELGSWFWARRRADLALRALWSASLHAARSRADRRRRSPQPALRRGPTQRSFGVFVNDGRSRGAPGRSSSRSSRTPATTHSQSSRQCGRPASQSRSSKAKVRATSAGQTAELRVWAKAIVSRVVHRGRPGRELRRQTRSQLSATRRLVCATASERRRRVVDRRVAHSRDGDQRRRKLTTPTAASMKRGRPVGRLLGGSLSTSELGQSHATATTAAPGGATARPTGGGRDDN